MAYRSDTNNRDIDNIIVETVFQGELHFDYSTSIPDLNYSLAVEALKGLNVEINEKHLRHRDCVEILYNDHDRETVYDLLE